MVSMNRLSPRRLCALTLLFHHRFQIHVNRTRLKESPIASTIFITPFLYSHVCSTSINLGEYLSSSCLPPWSISYIISCVILPGLSNLWCSFPSRFSLEAQFARSIDDGFPFYPVRDSVELISLILLREPEFWTTWLRNSAMMRGSLQTYSSSWSRLATLLSDASCCLEPG